MSTTLEIKNRHTLITQEGHVFQWGLQGGYTEDGQYYLSNFGAQKSCKTGIVFQNSGMVLGEVGEGQTTVTDDGHIIINGFHTGV